IAAPAASWEKSEAEGGHVDRRNDALLLVGIEELREVLLRHHGRSEDDLLLHVLLLKDRGSDLDRFGAEGRVEERAAQAVGRNHLEGLHGDGVIAGKPHLLAA